MMIEDALQEFAAAAKALGLVGAGLLAYYFSSRLGCCEMIGGCLAVLIPLLFFTLVGERVEERKESGRRVCPPSVTVVEPPEVHTGKARGIVDDVKTLCAIFLFPFVVLDSLLHLVHSGQMSSPAKHRAVGKGGHDGDAVALAKGLVFVLSLPFAALDTLGGPGSSRTSRKRSAQTPVLPRRAKGG
eukprot:Hpha_TRINITY_DN18322_c0_g1::TRINITY_DN18322_c0_g1_i1::g.158231::m.158231